MNDFTAHRLRVTAQVESPILLNEHPGAALRGALFGALRAQFCCNQAALSCTGCQLHASCPICFLVATVDDASDRGQEVPRPYVINPPLGGPVTTYAAGDTLEFSLTLFASAMDLFPYVVLALKKMEEAGLGRKSPDARGLWQRGRFRVAQVEAVNPLTGERQPVLRQGDNMVTVPNLPITHAQVLQATADCQPSVLCLDFLTPMRLTEHGLPLPRPEFAVLVQRLLERLDSLDRRFAGGGLDPGETYRLVGLAKGVRLVSDATRWVDLESYSARQGRRNSLSGFVGRASFAGEFAPFLPYLLWGQFTHAGKGAVKGNGVYEVTCQS